MAMGKIREICAYEDGSSVVKVIDVGMGPAFPKPYFVVVRIHGIPDIFYYSVEYNAKQYYEKICFMIDQQMESELQLLLRISDSNGS